MNNVKEDEAIARAAALLSDPYPGLLTWCGATRKALRDLRFIPIGNLPVLVKELKLAVDTQQQNNILKLLEELERLIGE